MPSLSRIVLILVIVAVLAGVALAASFFGTTRENTVDTTKDNMATAAAIPLIDNLTPARVETATFALG